MNDNTEAVINAFLASNNAEENTPVLEIEVTENEAKEIDVVEKQSGGFKGLGLMPKLLQTISELGYETPTPIQAQAIPLILDGQDLMGLAQTGTGKTAAFGLPLIQLLAKEDRHPEPREVRGLILAPTRELAKQISDNIRGFIQRTNLRCTVVVGGASIHFQKKKLEKGTDILVATPGRLMDLVERKALYLDKASFLVLDEADQMLDLGFIHVLRKISKLVRKPRQTMLFSATMPKQIDTLAQAYLTDPVRIEVARVGKAADKISQCVHFVDQGAKAEFLRDCLNKNKDDLSLVFSRTKHGAEKLMKRLVSWGFSANSIHGNKSQGQRERAIKAFRDGDIRVLVATDVAARGIDIPGVSHVYNFDLPDVPENYVHRIGRTARAGRDGEAVAFCSPTETNLLRAIQNLMKMTIEVASGEMPEMAPKGRGRSRNQGRGNRNSQRGQDNGRGQNARGGNGKHGNRGRDKQGSNGGRDADFKAALEFVDSEYSSETGSEQSQRPHKGRGHKNKHRANQNSNQRPGRNFSNDNANSSNNANNNEPGKVGKPKPAHAKRNGKNGKTSKKTRGGIKRNGGNRNPVAA